MPDLEQNLLFLQKNELFLASDFLVQNRPEMLQFSAKLDEINAKQNAQYAQSLPDLSLYFRGGYGNPSLNFLENKPNFYYIAGISLNWNFSNLYSTKQQHEIMRTEKLILSNQQDEFSLKLNIAAKQILEQIKSLKTQISQNETMLNLQQKITQNAKFQNENGILNMNDYLNEINKLHALNVEQSYQKIELLAQIYKIKMLINIWEEQN